ncbi:LytR family regulatory protein [Intrasporangium oryzae NRRL B-24470]|uniref:LytR family regulatory protein n=1 Tax=Intrasporangium oryzae NRRL B-24470 TaxID=1386089 RepID=W9G5L1_9MICO|nr:LCP family protein [Intrasporangium oryzae]EWT01451.1 LytR family regulatory protein [Intrasporangium oryzae NRRL B-24470]
MSQPYNPRTAARLTPGGRESLRKEIRSEFRRALGLTALGTVLPGAGLTQTRSKALGWFLLLVSLLGGAWVAYYVMTHGLTASALSLLSSPALLQLATVAFVIIGVLWCVSIIMTAVMARPARLDRARTRTLAAFTTVMVFLVAGSSYKAAEYAAITKDTVNQVFGTGSTHGATVVAGDDPWAETPRVNILLLGSDAGVGREGTRTDSMMVASIDTKSGRTTLISLPRNLQRVPLPESSPLRQLYPSGVYGRPTCIRAQTDAADQCMLNAIWTEVDQFRKNHPGSYSGEAPGRDETRNVIQEIVGLKIDHTVVIDLKGFEQLINAMGGVDVNVKLSGNGTKLPIGGHSDGHGGVIGEKGYFSPGRQHLTGNLALWYARTRAADDDGFRQARQRCVVQAVVQQVNPASMLGKYPELARIAKDNIYTDIPVQNLGAFATLIERVQKAKITSVALTLKQGISSVKPDFDLIRELVQKAIAPPPASTPTPSTTTTAKPTPTKKPTPTSTLKSYDEC